jgi:hypothetical protein
LAAALETIIGVGAIFGGGLLILGPDGHLLGMPTKMLAGTPFDSFLLPGILLFSFVGVVPLGAAVLTLRGSPAAPLSAVAVGLLLVGWISVEMVMLGGPQTLAWALYLVLGTAIALVGVSMAQSRALKR